MTERRRQPSDPRRVETGKRVRMAGELAGIHPAQLGRSLGYAQPGNIWRNLEGQRGFSIKQLQQIADLCGVDLNWLMSGVGEPRGKKPASVGALDVAPPRARVKLPKRARPTPPEVYALVAEGLVVPWTDADTEYLKERIEQGDSTDLRDMEVSLRGWRAAQSPPSDVEEQVRLFHDAIARRAQARGVQKYRPQPSDKSPSHRKRRGDAS